MEKRSVILNEGLFEGETRDSTWSSDRLGLAFAFSETFLGQREQADQEGSHVFGSNRRCRGEIVRTGAQSLVQGDGPLFADALTAEQMLQAFDDEGISSGDRNGTA